jgi:hypothetical protein
MSSIDTMPDAPIAPEQKPQTYRLLRTGDQPLAFEGRLIAEASGANINGRDRDRAHDVRVYQTAGGTHIVEIVYWSTWKGEPECRTVIVAGREPAGVAAALRKHDPLKSVMGYPPADRFRLKQDRLLARIRADYTTRVSDVLTCLPNAVERIE